MTVGERIQFHRKQKNLSQEELGQKLCISRQTVSLWEKDQTMPTVDNLLLLKDIFGITMDELLGVETHPEEAPAPLEVHTFVYKEEPLKKMYKSQMSILSLFLVILLAFTVAAWFGMGDWNNGVLVGSLLMADLAMAFILWNNSKERKHVLATFPDRTVTVSLFDGDLVLGTFREGEKPSQICIPYSEITNVVADAFFYQLHYGGKMYLFPMELFKKGELDPDSRLEILLKNNLSKNKLTTVKGLWRWLSFGLVYLCVLAPFLGILAMAGIATLIDGEAYFLFDYFWVYYPMLLIPVASIALGVYLRRKRKKAMKNIVAGILCGLILCSFGSAGDVDVYTDEEMAVDTFAWAECTMGLILPHTELMTNTLYEETPMEGDDYTFTSVCIAVITPAEKETFEKSVTADANWLEELPSELKAILPFDGGYDMILLYNTYTAEYNCLPEEEGVYQFACSVYDNETGVVTLWEFPWEKTE